MDAMLLFYITSGLFLGWSLGANDAANVFGAGVGSGMVSYRKAIAIASVFVVLGAVMQGGGGVKTLSDLGKIDALAGSFTVALSAAFTVFTMNKHKIPVSTSQAIVGAIIGWNFYTGHETSVASVSKIFLSWVLCPLLSAVFAIVLYQCIKYFFLRSKIHLLKIDASIRYLLVIVGGFGAYSLGANNIGNVMGVFVIAAPSKNLDLYLFSLTGIQQLFLVGGLAIAAGVITHSKTMMYAVGRNLMSLSSEAAIVAVTSHSLVLFIFSSQSLQSVFHALHLPAIPLVPVSSTQAIIGAIVGIGLLKGGRGIKYKYLGGIALGWITTPILAGTIAFISLFFVNNVFQQKVAEKHSITISNTNKSENKTVFTLNK